MYDDRHTMKAPADLGKDDRWGMILERQIFLLVSLVASEVVGQMTSAVTTVDPIFWKRTP